MLNPKSYKEACNGPNAMNDELNALANTQTWDLVSLPVGKNIIGCKWVYKVKSHSDGSLECYKARLVAKHFAQEYGIDTRCDLCSYCLDDHGASWSLYVKNAFLNGHMSEEVYMCRSPGLSHPSVLFVVSDMLSLVLNSLPVLCISGVIL